MYVHAPSRALMLLLVLAIALAGCSGAGEPSTDDGTAAPESEATETEQAEPETEATETESLQTESTEAEATEDGTESAAAEPSADPASSAGPSEEMPRFASDFRHVCETGEGYPGAAPYEQVAGTHPVVLFEELENGLIADAVVTLPDGWQVEEDTDFEDSSDIAANELVACATVAQRTPNGVTCELDSAEGTITLELVDATFDLAVHALSTGELVGTETIEAASTECPTFATVFEGQTEYLNSPTDEQYTTALQPYVSP